MNIDYCVICMMRALYLFKTFLDFELLKQRILLFLGWI